MEWSSVCTVEIGDVCIYVVVFDRTDQWRATGHVHKGLSYTHSPRISEEQQTRGTHKYKV